MWISFIYLILCRYGCEYLKLSKQQQKVNDQNCCWNTAAYVNEIRGFTLNACLDAPVLEDKSEGNIREATEAVKGIQMLTHFGREFARLACEMMKGLVQGKWISDLASRTYPPGARSGPDSGALSTANGFRANHHLYGNDRNVYIVNHYIQTLP